jgi:hypothetical protein
LTTAVEVQYYAASSGDGAGTTYPAQDIRRIVEKSDLPRNRQTLMFSATFPKALS